MTAETDLPPLPERFDCTNGSAQWCYGCYTMTRDDLGDYVLAEDYDALRNASEALQAEVEALRAEVERLRTDRDSWEQQASDRVADWHAEHLRAERLAEALRDAREFVAEALSDERAKFAGYEAVSDIAGIEATLQKIDAALGQGG